MKPKRNKKKEANQAKAKQMKNRGFVADVNGSITSAPTMEDMDKAYEEFLTNGSTLHLFIFGETGTRSWSFDPKKMNDYDAIVNTMKSVGGMVPSTMSEIVDFIGTCMDNDLDDKIGKFDIANLFIGYSALRQFLTTKTYKESTKFGMNTGVTSYLRGKDGSYIARFHGIRIVTGKQIGRAHV